MQNFNLKRSSCFAIPQTSSINAVKNLAKGRPSSIIKGYSSKGSTKSGKQMTSMKSYGSATTFRNQKCKKGKSKAKLLESYINKENTHLVYPLEKGREISHQISPDFSKTRNILSLKTRNISPNALKEIGERCSSTNDLHQNRKLSCLTPEAVQGVVVIDVIKELNEAMETLRSEITAEIHVLKENYELCYKENSDCKAKIQYLEEKVFSQESQITDLEAKITCLKSPYKKKEKRRPGVCNFMINLKSEERPKSAQEILVLNGEKKMKSRNEVSTKQSKIQCITTRDKMPFEGRSMSMKTTLERTLGTSNKTWEIEDEIKEMNIVESYDRRQGSLQPVELDDRNLVLAEEGHISKLRTFHNVSDMKSTGYKSLKKCKSDKLIHFPTILGQNKPKKNANKRLSYLERYQKVKELEVNLNSLRRDDLSQNRKLLKDRNIHKFCNAKLTQKTRLPQTAFTLSKNRSEADILAGINSRMHM
ncbi:unnamed protein product [Moneuplotes crassus]|uniref:Uncharacterized protein n=1 Tax=Euplotes crassus TaxID=5936 RepID=A0AAD1U8S2_EUPCR|nr:unnamed protein product [Moneuplotes crassus]